MEIDSLLMSLAEVHKYFALGVLFFGMIFEGETVLMLSGILVNLGFLGFKTTFFVAFLGVLVNDIVWYYLGFKIRKNFKDSRFVKFVENKVKTSFPGIEENPSKAIFISKFIAGLNHPTLIMLGILRTNFKQFIKLQLVASFLWTVMFLLIGIAFGQTAIKLSKMFYKFVIIIVLFIVAVNLVEGLLGKIIRKQK